MTNSESIHLIVSYFENSINQRTDRSCNELFCSTCGGISRYIKDTIDNKIFNLISDTLDRIHPSDLCKFGRWEVIIQYLSPAKYESLINQKKQAIDLNDSNEVNEYLLEVRDKLSFNDSSYNATVYQGIKLAIKQQDISLIETLILILGEKAMDYPQLVEIAINLSRSDYRLQRALYNKLRHVSEDVRMFVDPG